MKKVLIIVNTGKKESVALSVQINDFLQTQKIVSDIINFDGKKIDVDFSKYSFIVTLGGDGTVLFAARGAVEYGIPIFPVNLGQFGFIASVEPSNWKKPLETYLAGKAFYEERSMQKIQVKRNDKIIFEALALNDSVICASKITSTVLLDVNYDNLPLCHLKADGIIVSTPTGSTAYSAAAGGPIVDTHLDAFVMTPINSFSLSGRPIVLSTDGLLSISIANSRAKEMSLTVDGQKPFPLCIKDEIIITKFSKKVKLIFSCRERFYNALRSKLNWLGGPYA